MHNRIDMCKETARNLPGNTPYDCWGLKKNVSSERHTFLFKSFTEPPVCLPNVLSPAVGQTGGDGKVEFYD